MMNDVYAKKSKRLFIIWILSNIGLNFFSNIYVLHEKKVNNYNPITMLSGYQIFVLLIMIFYFLPLLYHVVHFAKLAELKKLYIATKIIFLHNLICIICLFVITILALFIPGLF